MNKSQRRGSGHSSLSIPLSDIDGVSHCDPDKYLEEARDFSVGHDTVRCIAQRSGEVARGFKISESNLKSDARIDGGVSSKDHTLNHPIPLTISLSSRQQCNGQVNQEEALSSSGQMARERIESLEQAIERSKQSHSALLDWDKNMGNKMSFSRTMSSTSTSRVLVEQTMKEMRSKLTRPHSM